MDSFNRGDIDALLGSISPTVVVIWQNGEVNQGPDAVRQFYTRMMTGPDSVVTKVAFLPEVEGRRFYGNTAVSYGTLNDRFTLRNGQELPLNSRWSSTREEGRIRSLILTSSRIRQHLRQSCPVSRLAAGCGPEPAVSSSVYRRGRARAAARKRDDCREPRDSG